MTVKRAAIYCALYFGAGFVWGATFEKRRRLFGQLERAKRGASCSGDYGYCALHGYH